MPRAGAALGPVADRVSAGDDRSARASRPARTPVEAAVSHLAAQPGARAAGQLRACARAVRAAWLARCCGLPGRHGGGDQPRAARGRRRDDLARAVAVACHAERAPEALQSLGHSDAVRLFIERAVKVRPNFAVTNDNAPHVAQICQDLDGIPLAIELAAARVRVLSVERIAARASPTASACSPAARAARCRGCRRCGRRSTGATSCSTRAERTLLRRLGVFHGGFTLDACEAVCADDRLDRYAVLDLLTSLVDKSLVLVEERESLSRYALLETVRHYALGPARRDQARPTGYANRHADAFRRARRNSKRQPTLGTDAGSGDVLGADAANLYAAIDHTAAGTSPRQRAAPVLGAGLLVGADRADRGRARSAGVGRWTRRPASRSLAALRRARSGEAISRGLRGRLRAHAASRARGARSSRHDLGDRANEARVLEVARASRNSGRTRTLPSRRSSRSGELAREAVATTGASPSRRRTSAGR